jgi:hypothetical protein
LPSPPVCHQAGWHPLAAVGFARGLVTERHGSSARQRSQIRRSVRPAHPRRRAAVTSRSGILRLRVVACRDHWPASRRGHPGVAVGCPVAWGQIHAAGPADDRVIADAEVRQPMTRCLATDGPVDAGDCGRLPRGPVLPGSHARPGRGIAARALACPTGRQGPRRVR